MKNRKSRKTTILLLLFLVLLYSYIPMPLWARDKKIEYVVKDSRLELTRLREEGLGLGFQPSAILQNFFCETSITATNIEWEIFKPNVYATEAIGLTLFWEGPVQISFEGVERLTSDEFSGDGINIWYAFTDQKPLRRQEPFRQGYIIEGIEEIRKVTDDYLLNWLSPEELNNYGITLLSNKANITSIRVNMWIMLSIDIGTRVANYTDRDGFFINVTARP